MRTRGDEMTASNFKKAVQNVVIDKSNARSGAGSPDTRKNSVIEDFAQRRKSRLSNIDLDSMALVNVDLERDPLGLASTGALPQITDAFH